jgi:predicted  nucleic acid-binding Zn-ribbon protein
MENEEQIRRLQEEITSKQTELMHLESLVAGAKERKANAEDELRNKGGRPAKKLKTAG